MRLMLLALTTFLYITPYFPKYTLWKAFHKVYLGT